MAQEVHTAFFSYCREDSEFALKLAEDLKVAGAHVWIDQLDIEPGTPWDRAVEEALTKSPRMLVVLSPVSVNSDNVRDEVSFALSRQKRVIPVLYRDCDVPFRLARLQHIDFRPDYERALRTLLRALGVELPQSSPSGVPVAVADAALSAAEAEESARQQKLEEERKLAVEQAELEKARKLAAERARLEEQRRAAAQKAAREHEQQRHDAEGRAGDEKQRREQRAAEQARLEEEARQAVERARLAQEEQERLAAEIRVRQEQLRREQQESVERRSMDLGRLEEQQQEFENKRRVAAKAAAKAPLPGEASRATPGSAASLSFLGNKRNALYLAGAAILLVVIAVTSYLFLRRGNPETPAEAKSAETTSATQAPQAQTPASQGSSTASSPANGSESAPANANPTEATGQKPPSDNSSAPTAGADQGKNKTVAATNLSTKAASTTSKLSSAEDKSGTPDRVSIPEAVSKGWIVRKVKPEYPPLARQARVQGEVVLAVVIARNGSVKSIAAESGHPMLIPAAIDAVKQWRYKPYKLDGRPVEVDTKVIVNFTLTN